MENRKEVTIEQVCIHYLAVQSGSEYQRIVFVYISSILSLLIFLVNALVAFVIKRTGQLSTQSTHLSFVICIIDIFHAIFGLTSTSLITFFVSYASCRVMLVLELVQDFFLAAPSTIIVLVTLDRYLHIRYLSNYSSTFTTNRYRISLALVFVVILLQAGAGNVTIIHSSIVKGKLVVINTSLVLLLISCVLYLVSHFHLRKLQKRGTMLSDHNKNITRIASLHLIIIVIFKVLPLLSMVLVKILEKHTEVQELNFLVCAYINLFLSSYTILIASTFMYVNRPARRYFIGRVQNLFPNTSVVPTAEESNR